MTLVGVGVLIIGIAFLILAIFLSHTLNNLASVLGSVNKTVEQLPEQLDDIFKETGNMLDESNHTLADVNDKLKQLSPLFYVLGDVGNVTRKFSSSMADATQSIKTKTEEGKETTEKNKLGGLYGTFALGYYWLKKRQESRKANEQGDTSDE